MDYSYCCDLLELTFPHGLIGYNQLERVINPQVKAYHKIILIFFISFKAFKVEKKLFCS